MPHLHDLPTDILNIILVYCQKPNKWHPSKHPRTHHLANLALASKPLLPLTQSILYSSFWSIEGSSTWRIRSFLCTLIADPTLASHVRNLFLRCYRVWDRESDEWDDGAYGGVYDDERRYSAKRNLRDRKLFKQAIIDLGFVDKKVWKDAVKKDVDEVYVALLLLVARNLREVGLSVSCNPVFIEKAFEHAATMAAAAASGWQTSASATRNPDVLTTPLSRLTELWLGCRGNVSDIDMRHTLVAFRLPALQTLTLSLLSSPYQNSDSGASGQDQVLLSSPNEFLTSLRLSESDVETRIMSHLIFSCKRLKILYYEHADRSYFRPEIQHHSLNLPELGSAICSIGPTLQRLELDVWGLSQGVLGSLRTCEHLKYLDTSLFNLLDGSEGAVTGLIKILPSSIEVLRIGIVRLELQEEPSERYNRMLSQVSHVLDRKEELFPRLSEIQVRTYGKCPPGLREVPRRSAVEDLIRACRKAGSALMEPFETKDGAMSLKDLRFT